MLSHVFCLPLVRGWLTLQLLLLLGDPDNIAPFCPTTVSTKRPNTAGSQHPFTSARAYFPSSFPPVSPFTSSSLSSLLLAGTGRKKHQLYPGCGWPGHYSTCEPQPAGPPGLGRVQACPAGQTQHRFLEAAAGAVGPAEVPSCNRPSDWVGTWAAPTPGVLEETGLEIKVSLYCLPPPPRAVHLLEYFCSEDCKHNVLKKS